MIKHYKPSGRYSVATIHNGVAYLCGHYASDLSKDIKGQTEEALDSIDKSLLEIGTDKSKMLSVMIHLKTMDDYAEMNSVYDNWVAKLPPARTCVVGEMFSNDCLIEVTVTAVV
ncbi:RidA family protein [Abyssisolibacter fermentans]|uniref:RidA family protein n=1 Tax=Abyssisolibacter fermentans TaxID=1766203 RepID=UPI00082CCDFC|nr:RidA family protein [Abyssisolibacter fermentans]